MWQTMRKVQQDSLKILGEFLTVGAAGHCTWIPNAGLLDLLLRVRSLDP